MAIAVAFVAWLGSASATYAAHHQLAEFVQVNVAYLGGKVDPSAYESVIRDRAAEGWSLVQIFVENSAASATEHVVIFSKPQG